MSATFEIGKHCIGGSKTFIIAEIGSNHNQSYELAIQSIDAAIDAGADAVKFQSIKVDELYYDPSPEIINLHKKIDFDESWHQLLSDYCSKKGIIFFSAPTYMKAVDLLEDVDVPLYKLASAQIGTFPQLVEKVIKTGKPVILSTGIVNFFELKKVIQLFEKFNNNQFVILHCNSIYPTPFDKVHLPVMKMISKEFNCLVGFSDHTPGDTAPIAAVAMGAKVIEKHFALSRNLPVPDAPFSLEPIEFRSMVDKIRQVEEMLVFNDRANLHNEEQEFKNGIKSRLVSKKILKAGAYVNKDDFHFLRHPSGVDARELNEIIAKKARYKRNISADFPINKDDLEGLE